MPDKIEYEPYTDDAAKFCCICIVVAGGLLVFSALALLAKLFY